MTAPALRTEDALLYATRDLLRQSSLFRDEDVNVEYDEMAPNLTGHKYVAVVPGDCSPGPSHNTSGGVIDQYVSIQVVVIIRCQDFPKDRMRDKFFVNNRTITQYTSEVMKYVDFSYDLLTVANAWLVSNEGTPQSGYPFVEPLKWAGHSKPRAVGAEFFDSRSAGGGTPHGLLRTINFARARRIVSR